MKKEPDVYISYMRSSGRKNAEGLCQKLAQRQIRAVLDDRQLPSTYDIGTLPERLIAASAVVLVCITHLSNQIDRFLLRELVYAKLLRKPIVYLLFPGVNPRELPHSYSAASIEFYDKKGKPDIMGGFQRLLIWLAQRPASASYPLVRDPHYHYLHGLYEDILNYLDTHSISPLENPTLQLPMLFSIPSHATPQGNRYKASEHVFEEFDNFYDGFDYLQNRSLLAGLEGVGKTLTLLSYARDAIVARFDDITHPLPLLVSATSWLGFETSAKSIELWLAKETGIDPTTLHELAACGQLALLVDNLHELRQGRHTEVMSQFLSQLHQYLDDGQIENKWLPRVPSRHNQFLVVCYCRDGRHLKEIGEHYGVIVQNQLHNEQIFEYLAGYPELIRLFSANAILLELCRQPFLLSAFTVAYGDSEDLPAALWQADDPSALQSKILNDYIAARYFREEDNDFVLDQDRLYSLLGQLAIEMLNETRIESSRESISSVSLELLDTILRPDEVEQVIVQLYTLKLMAFVPRQRERLAFTSTILRNHFALPYCLEWLQSEDTRTQRKAAWIAGEIHEARTIPLLIELLSHSSDKTVRREAAAALGKIAPSQAVEALIETGVTDGEWMVRQKAVEALGQFSGGNVQKAIYLALQDPKPNVRSSALLALVDCGDENLIEILIEALSDEDEGIRWIAKRELAKMGKVAIKPLFEMLRETDDGVRHLAVGALAHIGKPVIVQLINELIEGATDMRRGAGETLVQMGEDAIEPLLGVLKKNNQAHVKAIIATLMGEIKHPHCQKTLIELAQDQDAWVRISAIISLGQIGDTNAIPVLKTLLGDTSEPFYRERICDMAAQALLAIPDPQAQQIAHDWLEKQMNE